MRRRKWAIRGRPRGKGHSAVDTRILEYIAKISVRNWVDPYRFFSKIVDAWKNRMSTCKQLTIQCREKTRDRAVFLITSNHKVVAQFPMPEHLLKIVTPPKEFEYMIEREKDALRRRELAVSAR
ncbi:MAG: hypothetical protein PVH12_08420 [Candidatus Bathyarchaeota archaeon]